MVLALGACASMPTPPEPSYDATVTIAQEAAEAGHTRAAVDAYRRAAAIEPARKEPWQWLAVLNLEAGRSIPALAAAQETLQRDPADELANALYIASGMLIAAQAIQRMAAAGAVPGDANHELVLELVATMGEVFGADTLIPETERTRIASEAARRCRAKLQSPAAKEQPQPRRDPLDVLGGD